MDTATASVPPQGSADVLDLSAHPCFGADARTRYGRMHLPVALGCNVQCNYCDRRYDCANENRPGVTTAVLAPEQAADYVDVMVGRDPTIRVVGIAGPGDPLADPARTLRTLELVRQRHPRLLLCLATNGLALEQHSEALAALSVSHVTVTVNAVDPVIGGRIYAWVRRSAEPLRGSEAGAHLWESQRRGIAALVRLGVLVKVNTVLIPAVNESHVVEVAHAALRLGAARINCLPLHPIAGTPFGDRAAPSSCLLRRVQSECARYLPLMGHCARCRADAVGRVGQHRPEDYAPALQQRAARKDRPYIAVLSRERLLVNLRLGEAERVFVFGRSDDGYRLVDTRRARPTAAGVGRWLEIANLLSDCRALLVRGAGASAKAALSTSGVEVIETEGLIEDALDAVYQGRPVPRPRETSFRCAKNAGCAGSGTLCG